MMKFYAKSGESRYNPLLPILFLFFLSFKAQAQCPSGSVSPSNWATYNNGDVVCISSAYNGSFTLNNGARLFIASGGSFTGSLTAHPGSVVEVAVGGTFAPSGLWDFKGTLTNYGTAVLNQANFKSGAAIVNEGILSGNGLQYPEGPMTITNAVCGTVNLPSLQVKDKVTFNNNGRLNVSGSFDVQSGGAFNNRGRLYGSGSAVIVGKVLNESWMVFSGGVSLNPGDSLVNLHFFVSGGNVTVNKPIRNDGLVMVNGTVNFNSAGTLRQTNPVALFRIAGSMTRDNVSYTGGRLYVGGANAYNNSQLNGISAASQLTVNRTMSNLGSHVVVDASMVAHDTSTFVNSYGTPLSCQNTHLPTPVKLGYFEAAEKNGKVYLEWTTETETSHDHFTVEYATDGKSFSALEDVAGAGNSATTRQYSYVHQRPAAGFNFYRLRIVSVSGEVEYSPVVRLNLSSSLSVEQVKSYPNPFVDRINLDVKLDRAQQVGVMLVDNTGKVLRARNLQLSAGRHTVEMTGLGAFAKGIYTVVVQAEDQRIAMKLMK